MNTLHTGKRLFSTRSVVIVGAKRTPIGGFLGKLSDIPAPQLGAAAARGAMEHAGIQPTDIEESFFGQVIPAGCGQAPDRQVIMEAGCDVDTPTTLINKVCASGMKSVMIAAQQIRLGDRNICLAGGMENMSKLPHYLFLRKPTSYGHASVIDAI